MVLGSRGALLTIARFAAGGKTTNGDDNDLKKSSSLITFSRAVRVDRQSKFYRSVMNNMSQMYNDTAVTFRSADTASE